MKKMVHSSDEQPKSNEPTHDQIAERAYEIFLARGATNGQDIEDWLCAERDLCAPRDTDDPA